MLEPAVLVVEDEVIVAMDLATKLRALKYHVIETVSSGEDALRLAEQRRPDLVLLDLKLAGPLDGIQTAQQLKQYDIPIVFVTANSDRETLKKANALEPSGYILKPFGERDLAIQLDIALYKHHANRRLLENGQRLKQANETLALETAALSRLTELSSRLWRKGSLREGLEEMLGATIELLRADMGNIQLLSDGALSIVAQRGFQQDFLDFFREVSVGDDSACGRALREGERIVIQDVECDPPYAALREVARKAGYRAVQSTPLIGHNGEPLGMLSTHWRSVHHPTVQELRRLDLYVRQAVDFIQRLKTHEALRISEEGLRQATNHLELAQQAGSVGFYDYYFDENRSVWTKGLARLFGISLDEYEGTWEGWAKRVVPEDAEEVRRLVVAATRERREHVSYDFRAIMPDGNIRWLAGRGQIFYGASDKPLRMAGVNIDMTDHKRAQQDLLKSEDLLLRAQRAAKVGVWEIDLRTNQLTWSRPYYDLFGLNYSVEPSVNVWLSRIHPEDRPRVAAEHDLSIRERRDQNMEFRIHGADNGAVRWIHRRGKVECDHRGQAIRIQGISFDITERKHAEQAIKSIALFPAENPAPILRVSSAGILLYRNPASTQVFEEWQLCVGRPAPRFLHHFVLNAFRAAKAVEQQYHMGSRVYLVTTVPIPDEDYANLYWHDITERHEAESALRESEERFRRLVEVSSEMAWTTDADGIPREDSPSWRKFTGFRLDQYIHGSQWLEAIHPEDRQRVAEVWQEACRTRSHYTVETRMRRADGAYRRIFARALPLLNEDGSVRQWVGMNCDVTDLRASEEALCESEERFRTLGDHMTQFAWMIDQSGEAVWFNRRWYEYTGCTPEQMHGWGWRSVHHPDHEERVVASWRRALATGEPWDETFPLRGANGQYRWFLTRAVPVKDAQGSLVRWFGTNTDITELRSIEAALHESQERLNAIVQTAVDGIITIDEKGTIESINPAVERIFHYAEEELIGHNVKMLMPEPDRRRHDDYLQRYRQTGEKKIIGIGREVLGRRKDGLVFPVELSISESRLPGRRFFTGILRDISVRKKAEEQLRLLTIELDQRVASRTQELEQSQDRLRALATELNLAEQRERKRLAAELHDHLQQMLVLGKIKLGQGKRIVESNAAYLKVLQETDDIFSESLKYTRTLVAELSPPALREGGLPAALTWLADSMKKHELNVIVKIPDGKLPALPEDQAVLLFQSTRELLINSSKHAGTQEAWVTVTYGNGKLTIEVKDEGAGFDVAVTGVAEIAGGLSSRFGLFSVQERMKALGGSLEIRSVLGAGTRATLTLPSTPMANSASHDLPLQPQRPAFSQHEKCT